MTGDTSTVNNAEHGGQCRLRGHRRVWDSPQSQVRCLTGRTLPDSTPLKGWHRRHARREKPRLRDRAPTTPQGTEFALGIHRRHHCRLRTNAEESTGSCRAKVGSRIPDSPSPRNRLRRPLASHRQRAAGCRQRGDNERRRKPNPANQPDGGRPRSLRPNPTAFNSRALTVTARGRYPGSRW